jgi:hypothetical protein
VLEQVDLEVGRAAELLFHAVRLVGLDDDHAELPAHRVRHDAVPAGGAVVHEHAGVVGREGHRLGLARHDVADVVRRLGVGGVDGEAVGDGVLVADGDLDRVALLDDHLGRGAGAVEGEALEVDAFTDVDDVGAGDELEALHLALREGRTEEQDGNGEQGGERAGEGHGSTSFRGVRFGETGRAEDSRIHASKLRDAPPLTQSQMSQFGPIGRDLDGHAPAPPSEMLARIAQAARARCETLCPDAPQDLPHARRNLQ